jgi:penicillin amidase/acyl-homoserine-lactone acylase
MIKRFPWRKFLLVFGIVTVAAAAYIFWPQRVNLDHLLNSGDPYDARILRDTWGVPHIFGVTDADASFGLAYANAEDDFITIQQTLAAARGSLASIYGTNAAANDYMVHLLRIWDLLEANYESDLSTETREVLDGYAAGINLYAALHPEEVLAESLFPVGGIDIAAGSIHKSPLFFGLDGDLGELFAEERQGEISPGPRSFLYPSSAQLGSNIFAIGPSRTSDGSTYLAINSHQPWQGPVTWYEAHIHSEEGLDVVGGIFPGSPLILVGHNRNLGWGFTVSRPDLVDTYVLETDPDDPNRYRYDDEWLNLEVRQAPIRVNLIGRLTITVTQEVLWSVYGPVIRQEHGTYAVRYAGMELVDIWDQIYGLNRAANLGEWREAMSDGGFASFNVGYADGAGNIFYLYNADLPLRAEGYDWSMYLPGHTSETLWTEFLPFDSLPQVLNPSSGFIQNANSSPFQTTVGPDNPRPEDFSVTLGIETGMSNRALRALELFGQDDSITFEEFKLYKYDMTYSHDSDVVEIVEMILDSSLSDHPDYLQALDVLRRWNFAASPENEEAALAIFTLYHLTEISENFSASRMVSGGVTQDEAVEAFQLAVSTMEENFERLRVPWGEVNRIQRGEVDLGMGGGPDLLHAMYGSLQEDGRIRGFTGDSYVMLIAWDKAGAVQSYSIHQYGSATQDEASPHYSDQVPLFARRELKPVWFDEADILANLEMEYRPGEEIEK